MYCGIKPGSCIISFWQVAYRLRSRGCPTEIAVVLALLKCLWLQGWDLPCITFEGSTVVDTVLVGYVGILLRLFFLEN